MKKRLFIAVAVVCTAMAATPAFAHGSHRGGQRMVSYSVCSVENCTLTGLHKHDGGTYAAHYYGDGHEYHAYGGYHAGGRHH